MQGKISDRYKIHTKLVWNSFKSTLRAPSNLVIHKYVIKISSLSLTSPEASGDG